MASALVNGLRYTNNLQTLNLRRSYIKTDSAIELLRNLPAQVQNIDMSYNPELEISFYRKLTKAFDKDKLRYVKQL